MKPEPAPDHPQTEATGRVCDNCGSEYPARCGLSGRKWANGDPACCENVVFHADPAPPQPDQGQPCPECHYPVAGAHYPECQTWKVAQPDQGKAPLDFDHWRMSERMRTNDPTKDQRIAPRECIAAARDSLSQAYGATDPRIIVSELRSALDWMRRGFEQIV